MEASRNLIRPVNINPPWPFHQLLELLFSPLENIRKKASASSSISLHSRGHNGKHDRQRIVERFIAKWRNEIGDDIYPAFRLIVPQRDRDRPTYGLKEFSIARLLIRVMKINRSSDDAIALLNWKQPSHVSFTRMAGDFAGRCYEVFLKRPMLTQAGGMTITEVNESLDRLACADHAAQLEIFTKLYTSMCPEELMWLIRIILQQMKIGMTERTLFNVWHPDAELLFNVSSNLRRICWELYDPSARLQRDKNEVTLMQCFQPQLAQFQSRNLPKMVARMQRLDSEQCFWIEEKLDGERVQLHMNSNDAVSGGREFRFWSRKAKDYTYLYGNGLQDGRSALTQHLTAAFDDSVRSIILDGEMITWDPQEDLMVPFGTLKTAAVGQQENPFDSTGWRPLYKVFDILHLNGLDLTPFALRDRRVALNRAIKDVHRRLEKHHFKEAQNVNDVEVELRRVIAESSEGLVLKNPLSPYRLNQRNDDWTKVKPEYMDEFGENLDCLIIGGYYGSGRRGGKLSSFLCGLRVDASSAPQNLPSMQFYSFFRVGGGFSIADYAAIRHQTEGKWNKWDNDNPPAGFILLAGDKKQQFERPDEWIRPDESVVIEVKAASTAPTDQFRTRITLRFPRFRRIRNDRNWCNALSFADFAALKAKAEEQRDQHSEKRLEVNYSKRQRPKRSPQKALVVSGQSGQMNIDILPSKNRAPSNVFNGQIFHIMTGAKARLDLSKADLEHLVKQNGGTISQTTSSPCVILVADKNTVHVASVIKATKPMIRNSKWILDSIIQPQFDFPLQHHSLPVEPCHLFFASADQNRVAEGNVDRQGDSFVRDVDRGEMRTILTCERWPGHIRQSISHRKSCAAVKRQIASIAMEDDRTTNSLKSGIATK